MKINNIYQKKGEKLNDFLFKTSGKARIILNSDWIVVIMLKN